MYIFKNAITSILRNKGRNILIGIIIVVIACAVSITLAINNTSSKLIESYESKYEVEATITMNRENMMKDFDPENKDESKENMKDMFEEASSVTVDDVKNYGDSTYVKDYYYTLSAGVNSTNIDPATSDESNDKADGHGMSKMNITESSSDFTLKGYSTLTSMEEFIEGTYTITDGAVFEDFDGNYCLINSELATLNDISVGDTIKIQDPNNTSKTYKLEVAGIFEESEDSSKGGMSMFSNSANTIIVSTNTIESIQEADEDLNVEVSPTFILTSSDVVESFTSELTEKGLSDSLTVSTNLDQVENATSTISNVKTFAVTFLIITLVIGATVLLIINMINLRERKYEIGVLRTIGMKKSKVCLQFMLELFIVAIVSLFIGAGIGSCLSVPISNSLLQNEISSSQNETNDIKNNFGNMDDKSFDKKNFQGVNVPQAYDSIDAVVDFKVLGELLGIGVLLTLISSISAITSIQRFSPLSILKERS